jgi:hypothetical protein
MKYGGRWLSERYSDPVDIDYAENGTVIGYKCLSVFAGRLVSPVYNYKWKDGWNEASHNHRYGARPGFYAFRKKFEAIDAAQSQYSIPVKLEMAGKVIVCEGGYRSEYARIVGILPSDYSRNHEQFVSEKLGLPIVTE